MEIKKKFSSLKILKIKFNQLKTNIIILKSVNSFIVTMILLKLFNLEIKL